jgi:23S rRNA pseudouridine2457 synthase
MLQYFIIYKPYQVLSQFSSEPGKRTLKDFFQVPSDVYSVGRLDYDSEGLLILTNDKEVNHRLLNPLFQHEREYWVQVEGNIQTIDTGKLEAGVTINVEGKNFFTKNCTASILEEPPDVQERVPPIRFRKNIPTSWIKIIVREGKNRQVRKMTAAIGFPTLRLIRARIEGLHLQPLHIAEIKELSKKAIYSKLFRE